MQLENKTAMVYGGSVSVGGAVASAFARKEANVFLAGRTLATLDRVAEVADAATLMASDRERDHRGHRQRHLRLYR